MESQEIGLTGGNMSKPVLKDNIVYKDIHPASPNIHKLLCYVREKGIDWVPKSYGLSDNRHALSFITGTVIHDNPKWIFSTRILKECALKLRAWHDATVGFQQVNGEWLLSNDEPHEVICHNDFAPYNWVFNKQKRVVGLIDFDTCSPGSRVWDIAYAAYRIVPLMPHDDVSVYYETSPFSYNKMIKRLELFLKVYSKGQSSVKYSVESVIGKAQLRLCTIAAWSDTEGTRANNQELLDHARMYRLHAEWLRSKSAR